MPFYFTVDICPTLTTSKIADIILVGVLLSDDICPCDFHPGQILLRPNICGGHNDLYLTYLKENIVHTENSFRMELVGMNLAM